MLSTLFLTVDSESLSLAMCGLNCIVADKTQYRIPTFYLKLDIPV